MKLSLLASVFLLSNVCFADSPTAPVKDEKPSWEKSIALGFSLTRGNSETLLVTGNTRLAKENKKQIYLFEISGAYGETDNEIEGTEETETEVTQQNVNANAEFKHKFTERFYAGFSTTYLYDKVSKIDYRVTPKPLVGYFLLKDETFRLNFDLSPAYVFERVDDIEDDYFAPLIAERFEWKVSDTAKLYQAAEYLFELEDTSNYIVNAELGLETRVTELASLVLSVKNRFENQPADDAEQNDLSVISSLKFSF